MIDLMTLREFVWGPWLLCLFLAAGVCIAARLAGDLMRARALPDERPRCGALPDEKPAGGRRCGVLPAERHADNRRAGGRRAGEKQFLTSCTALAATLGTGNIAGVATALTAGGPGAVFWMWICALLGMATAYGETYLGIRYRKKGADQSWLSGPFLYLSDGLKKPAAGCCYAVFCMLAALGMGSMVQANSIAESVSLLAPIDPAAAAVVVTALAASVFLGGIRRISEAASVLVPVSAALYLVFGGILLLSCARELPGAFSQIFAGALRPESAAGGAAGYGIRAALINGCSRGVFSNEAGLGSLAILHGCAPEHASPGQQGLWAMFEVFFDTIVNCTLTALILLCANAPLQGPETGSRLVASCFCAVYGPAGGRLVAACLILFAFATIIAWYYLGRQAALWLAGKSRARAAVLGNLYPAGCLLSLFTGCVGRLETVWAISDIFNGLMAVPNLLALFALSGQIRAPGCAEPGNFRQEQKKNETKK